ncbi:MAG: NAD(P)H-hydrate dehydratase [Acidimicrobiia bacterium]|nr:NAD(P)H-hydrate dehydratase [Acidimicrobiia bacterium]
MKPVLTSDEYRRIDKAYSGDLDQAMDRAGFAVSQAAHRAGAAYGRRVAVLAGTGNNGGDGYVAARYLQTRGASVEIHPLGPPKTAEAAHAAALAYDAGVRQVEFGVPADEDVVIDALFGGGAREGLPARIFPWMETPAPVVAVDFPTGLDANTGKVAEQAFRAVETVTFGALKTGHLRGVGPDYCGTVTVVDIGITGGEPVMFVAEAEDTVLPRRDRTAHKWSAGGVLVVGGSPGLTGAAVLAAAGALGFGSGAVAIASTARETIAANTAEFPTFLLDAAVDHVDRFDVVIFGPGLAEADLAAALPIVASAKRLVIDAGGLVPQVLDLAVESGAAIIVTPHAGEFSRVAGVGGGAYSVRALAHKLEGVVLLKGSPNLISDGGPPVLVDVGGPELATIGTGDVLAGMIAALWARGCSPIEAATTGAYLHAVAASDLRRDGVVTASRLASVIDRYAG